ncbi:MAG: hypothetical protein QME60_04875 [Verrucomicrobiota bacterium]|nr:hypothetical protein [Verrucomicrobiota bacterium]
MAQRADRISSGRSGRKSARQSLVAGKARVESPGGKSWRRGAALAVGFCLAAPAVFGQAQAQTEPAPAGPATARTVVLEHAEELDYDPASGWVVALGAARIRAGDQELRADEVRVNMKTQEAQAKGNVRLKSPRGDLSGETLTGNFGTGEWTGGGVVADATPFRLLRSDRVTRAAGNKLVVKQGELTTCTNVADHVHFRVTAGEVELVPGDYLKARHVVWRFGSVPVLYLPYWYRNLEENLGWDVQPGHSSRMGTFLLNSYSYRLNHRLTAETRLDYRARRGFAAGQELHGRDREKKLWRNDVEAYYADDQKPVDKDDDAERDDLDSRRHRFRVAHGYAVSDRDDVQLQAQYLSDTDVLEDFFEREFRRSPQPENFAVYTRRGNGCVGGLLFRGRLNDFYTDVNRLPEASFDWLRAEIGSGGFYYESHSAAGYLEKVWASSVTNRDDYAVFRADSAHMFYHPGRYWGFLNVIPRAGGRLTCYSMTKDLQTLTVGANTVVSEEEAGPGLRARPEAGCEVSCRAFKTWRDGVVSPLRHVVEPYCNYTLATEPNLLPEYLYAFDSVDTLRRDYSLKFGMRNKWQTKRDDFLFQFASIDTYTTRRIEPNKGEKDFDFFHFDAEVIPAEWLRFDAEGAYDWHEGAVQTFDGRITLRPREGWRGAAEYLERRDKNRLFAVDATFSPNRRWDFNGYGRYEFEDARLEEIGGFVQRNLDCMAVRTGVGYQPRHTWDDGTERDEDWRFIVEMWLTAFPKVKIGAR